MKSELAPKTKFRLQSGKPTSTIYHVKLALSITPDTTTAIPRTWRRGGGSYKASYEPHMTFRITLYNRSFWIRKSQDSSSNLTQQAFITPGVFWLSSFIDPLIKKHTIGIGQLSRLDSWALHSEIPIHGSLAAKMPVGVLGRVLTRTASYRQRKSPTQIW